jgi:carbon storage regulator
MLVLSRRKNEKIVIDGGIIVTILESKGGRVRLGIDAPKSVVINREEVAADIARKLRKNGGAK